MDEDSVGPSDFRPESRRSSNASSRREKIPDRPKVTTLNLWSCLRNCAGKDLTRVAMPVHFNEPLSLLQRSTEIFEYSEILDRAANCECPYEQLTYLAVFVISGYSSTARTTKPFNPLLGETYEFDRTDDLGWRVICEQVAHHPPTIAQYCEGRQWTLWQDYSMESKFNTNDIQIVPKGHAHVKFHNDNAYSWNKIVTMVHNFVVGTMWIDQQGDVAIIGRNNSEGLTCNVKFLPSSGGPQKKSKGDIRKIEGDVCDAHGNIKFKINGAWDYHVEIWPVEKNSRAELVYGNAIEAWRCRDPVDGSENFYGLFACGLNEMEDNTAPTDSRLRPDQKLLEDGKLDEANTEKLRLEDKQRVSIREGYQRISGNEVMEYNPIWFTPIRNDDGELVHVYNGNYWECKEKQDWSMCPVIFS